MYLKMKTRKLFLALTLPMAFAACTNEEFIENNAAPAKDNLVELGEGFALAIQGTNDASTRGVWETENGKLSWSWLPEILASTTGANSTMGALNVAADEIGLCWTGELPDGTGSIGNMVYTNYQFQHDGWLAEGQDAADIDACSPYTLLNGKIYSGITAGSLDENSTLSDIKTQLTGSANEVTINGTATALNLNTGVFKTNNKAIFGGSYIAYYPYNSNFADAASLPAVSPVSYEYVTLDEVTAAHVAKNTFMVGYAQNLVGGAQASKLSLNPLSAIISLQLKGAAGVTNNVAKVALWSQDGFVTSVALDASKIKTSGAAAGEALYVEGSKKTASTIVAALKSSMTLSTTAQKIYLPILPTTAKDLKVIVYTDDNKVAVINLGKDYTFKAAQGTVVSVELAANDFSANTLIAVDAASLKAAVEGTYTVATNVTVIGDITTGDVEVKDYVTVEGGKIIVPEDKTLTIAKGATVKSTVDVEGQTCCGGSTNAGAMVVEAGATVAGNVNVLAGYEGKDAGSMTFNHTANETSLVAATATIVSDGNIDFKGATDIRGTLTLNADAEAKLSVATSDVNVKGGTVNNNGTFEVEAGKFAMLNASGNTEAAAGKNFKNNGTFIDNVGTTIGGATQYMEMTANGDYICKVNEQKRLNEAYANKTACSTIQFVNSATATYDLKDAAMHNGKHVNLVDAGTAATTIVNSSTTANVNVGNLTASGSSLTVNVGRAIQVNGDIVLNSDFSTAEDVQGMTANNLIVNKGATATFANRDAKLGVTLAVSSTIEVKKDATFTITAAIAGKNIADVTCKKLIEGGTFNGKPRVIE